MAFAQNTAILPELVAPSHGQTEEARLLSIWRMNRH